MFNDKHKSTSFLCDSIRKRISYEIDDVRDISIFLELSVHHCLSLFLLQIIFLEFLFNLLFVFLAKTCTLVAYKRSFKD